MQVAILCGGQGTRIRDVAEDIPKPMIPIGNRPILWHIMKRYAQYGCKDFILCLGYKSWIIKQYFLNYHLAESDFSVTLRPGGSQVRLHDACFSEDWTITFAETGLESMTGCRVQRIEKYVKGDAFMLTYGDGVADIDIGRLVEFHSRHGKLATITAVNPPSRFGELEMCGDQVVEFNEKTQVERGWINGGFFVLNRAIFSRLADDPSLVFEQAPLTGLAGDGELMAYRHHGFWHPMDCSRDHRYLNELWHAGKAPWARLPAATVRQAA